MYAFFKPFLFALSPETAHRITTALLDRAAAFSPTNRLLKHLFRFDHPKLAKEVMGLHFPNPIGLAAGFDKNGKHIQGMACLGFGFLEIGTVTPRPQAGNEQPRLFRLPADHALINRMGFNNDGLEALVNQLTALRAQGVPNDIIIGGNIGKNKTTPNEAAEQDYLACFEALFPLVDYFVVNVSSPNTPNLRALQEKEPLSRLLLALQSSNEAKEKPKPILLKIAPDLNDAQLDDIAEILLTTKIAGVIASNTTISRENLHTKSTEIESIGAGGLSGAPLEKRSTEIIVRLREKIGTDLVIIGVGGIETPEAAQKKLDAGADLVQVYTGLVYQGPSLIRSILKSLISI